LGFFCYGFKYLNDLSELDVSLTERPSVEGLEPNLFMVSSNKRGKHLNFSASRHTSSAFLQKSSLSKGFARPAFLPATAHVIQWRGSQVRKVGGKVFGISRSGDMNFVGVTFKVSELTYEILRKNPDYARLFIWPHAA
jgi:hypothetical protein